MEKKSPTKIIVSAIIGIIIDQVLSITERLREVLQPFMIGPVFTPIAQTLIVLCFFLIEIMGVYQLINYLSRYSFRSKGS